MELNHKFDLNTITETDPPQLWVCTYETDLVIPGSHAAGPVQTCRHDVRGSVHSLGEDKHDHILICRESLSVELCRPHDLLHLNIDNVSMTTSMQERQYVSQHIQGTHSISYGKAPSLRGNHPCYSTVTSWNCKVGTLLIFQYSKVCAFIVQGRHPPHIPRYALSNCKVGTLLILQGMHFHIAR